MLVIVETQVLSWRVGRSVRNWSQNNFNFFCVNVSNIVPSSDFELVDLAYLSKSCCFVDSDVWLVVQSWDTIFNQSVQVSIIASVQVIVGYWAPTIIFRSCPLNLNRSFCCKHELWILNHWWFQAGQKHRVITLLSKPIKVSSDHIEWVLTVALQILYKELSSVRVVWPIINNLCIFFVISTSHKQLVT